MHQDWSVLFIPHDKLRGLSETFFPLDANRQHVPNLSWIILTIRLFLDTSKAFRCCRDSAWINQKEHIHFLHISPVSCHPAGSQWWAALVPAKIWNSKTLMLSCYHHTVVDISWISSEHRGSIHILDSSAISKWVFFKVTSLIYTNIC